MNVGYVVGVLKDAGFCGDGNILTKGDVSVTVRDRTVLVSYKFGIVGFNIDGLYIDYSALGWIGVLSISDKDGACMVLVV